MGACKALILAGAVVIGPATLAVAADLPPPPMIEAPPEPVEVSGWYLRGDVGVGIAESPDIRSTFYDSSFAPLSGAALNSTVPSFARNSQHIGDSAIVDVGIGYQYSSWLRFDVTGEYRTGQDISTLESYGIRGSDYSYSYQDANGVSQKGTGTGNYRGFDQYHGNVQSSVFLFNAYTDIGTWYGFTPFIGAGVGASYNQVTSLYDVGVGGPTIIDANNKNTVITGGVGNGGYGYAKSSGHFDLAYAAMAGIDYAISPDVKLELSYRYLNMGEAKSGFINCVNSTGCVSEKHSYSLASNDIRLGFRWLFTDVTPYQPVVYPAPPIVRKY
ncbi:outer membrane protein [Lichenifustis flavocetrariae]|uniref:Porin family protein n=1 Tax=Lichenifustis flavocetrariae TaxID=2949735 RepID=A0AA42CP64_9HYPH|nr:porin family protein [Lichenifustis flavocetrariae]MCW6510112.1 porin family protein [Lichenifustis flavocetrariae]